MFDCMQAKINLTDISFVFTVQWTHLHAVCAKPWTDQPFLYLKQTAESVNRMRLFLIMEPSADHRSFSDNIAVGDW